MPNATDPSAPPAYVLNALHGANYEPYAVDDGPTMYRLPGQAPKPWKTCMEDIGAENTRLRDENAALVAKVARMTEVEHKPRWWPSKELVLTVMGVVPMGAVTIFSVVGENAGTLLGPPYGHVVGVLATGLAAKILKDYLGSDAKKTVAAMEEKRAIAEESKP